MKPAVVLKTPSSKYSLTTNKGAVVRVSQCAAELPLLPGLARQRASGELDQPSLSSAMSGFPLIPLTKTSVPSELVVLVTTI